MVDRSFGTFDPKISINGDTRHSNGLMPPDGDRAEAQGDLASLSADIVMGPGNFGACPRVLKQLAAHDDFASKRSEEQTSEHQSLMRTSYAVFCLKKTQTQNAHF